MGPGTFGSDSVPLGEGFSLQDDMPPNPDEEGSSGTEHPGANFQDAL